MTFRPHALIAPLFALLLLSGCSIELQHGLNEADANEIYVLLNKNGINAAKQKETGDQATFTIVVPKGDAAQAAELLKVNSLPRPVEKGLNHFAKGGMVPTATEERAMMLKAMAGEVSNALNQIDGILEARVIVMVPETSDLTQPENKPMPSSSVLVKFRPSEDGSPPISAEAVKQFVATAVPEMKPSSVTVVMTQALPPSAEVNAENRLQDVLGLRMTASSASQFRVMVAVSALLILAMLGLSAWTFMRGGSEGAAARPRGR